MEKNNAVVIFSKTYCPYCSDVKDLFDQLRVDYIKIELDDSPNGPEMQQALIAMTGMRTVPQVFINGTKIQ